ncbi:DUF2214 family protein [Aquincola sp. S2]|uniref:DUF2214 family protein n=1 Tax=Pseudaquabacterium terrae TaxID=2732868 RepID=A0ABX2EH07_9BURK|nr:DUF2214 family protein [Aquabacterium terrae]
MLFDSLLAYAHFVALIGTASLLVAELLLARPNLRADALLRLQRIDATYAAFAVATLATGALRIFFGLKGSAYYLSNPVFHAKFGLFVLVGLLSIPPTLRFIQWAKAARADAGFTPPADALKRVRRWLLIEVHLLALIPLLATLMAHGITGRRG